MEKPPVGLSGHLQCLFQDSSPGIACCGHHHPVIIYHIHGGLHV